MKELLEYLVKRLVSEPEKVKVVRSEKDKGLIHLSLSVSPKDMGMIIGKNGKHIAALRSLTKTTATKRGGKVFLELREQLEKKP